MDVARIMTVVVTGCAAGLGSLIAPVSAQEYEPYPLEARVWLDRGSEPVLGRGDRVRLYYRVSESAFVAIFQIDTNGAVRMIFPTSPQENHYARGGRDYRVLFPGSSYWYVADDPGVGYFFIVASPQPFDFSQFGYSHFTGGWDLNRVGRQVYGDPYLAMDDYVASLIPDWEYVGYGLDFAAYHVERHYDYPRFLCYDCHGFQPFYSWNPYAYSCATFRVVIYDDPYYYPATRYRGTRVVYARPRRGVPHFAFKERAAGEAGTPQVVVRNSQPSSRPGVEGTENRRAVPRAGTGAVAGSGAQTQPGAGVQDLRSGTRPGVTQVPNTRSGVERTDPSSSLRPGSTGRPILERRPSGSAAGTGGSGTVGRPTVTRPSARVRKPGSGGGTSTVRTVPTVRTGGGNGVGSSAIPRSGSTVRIPSTVRSGRGAASSNPTVRSGGSTVRTPATVRSGGTVTRTNPAVRGGGSPTRSNPVVRSGGTANRSNPVVRSGGSTVRSNPVVRNPRSGGGTQQPKTVPKPSRTRPTRPGSGGGGGS
jgi:hypothetical protein